MQQRVIDGLCSHMREKMIPRKTQLKKGHDCRLGGQIADGAGSAGSGRNMKSSF